MIDNFEKNIGTDSALIERLKPEDEYEAIDLIRQNLSSHEEKCGLIDSTYRRIEMLLDFYQQKGSAYYVLKDQKHKKIIGGVGIAPFAELPPEEQLGEIRDLVVDNTHRNQGLGKLLLKHCLQIAKNLGYKRLYLETTIEMDQLAVISRKYGFSPITEKATVIRSNPSSSRFFTLNLD